MFILVVGDLPYGRGSYRYEAVKRYLYFGGHFIVLLSR